MNANENREYSLRVTPFYRNIPTNNCNFVLRIYIVGS